ncbi:MAG: hypothetical protein M3116_04615, partial [Actinomycetota bacterium]|nr:hypothetical protein [Actinomycetota bacterium]
QGERGQRQLIDRLAWLRQGTAGDAARHHFSYVGPFPPTDGSVAAMRYRLKSRAFETAKRLLR